MLKIHQENLIKFLIKTSTMKFGEFILKSGRIAPYYFNFGEINSAESISNLGEFYAEEIISKNLTTVDTIFGPAYKGVPIAVSTAQALFRKTGKNVGFTFNRKEAKTHGEKGMLVGTSITQGTKVILVEDVVSAGTTMKEVIPTILNLGARLEAIIVSVDRAEKGGSELSAVQEVVNEFKVPIYAIIHLEDAVNYLSKENNSGFILNAELLEKIKKYRSTYGVSK